MKKNACWGVHSWALFLALFKYAMEHRQGRLIAHADNLRQNPLPEVMVIGECDDSIIARLKRSQREDKNLQVLLTMTENKEKDSNSFVFYISSFMEMMYANT